MIQHVYSVKKKTKYKCTNTNESMHSERGQIITILAKHLMLENTNDWAGTECWLRKLVKISDYSPQELLTDT